MDMMGTKHAAPSHQFSSVLLLEQLLEKQLLLWTLHVRSRDQWMSVYRSPLGFFNECSMQGCSALPHVRLGFQDL